MSRGVSNLTGVSNEVVAEYRLNVDCMCVHGVP